MFASCMLSTLPLAMQMAENSFLARDVDLESLSERTKNFSGRGLQSLTRHVRLHAIILLVPHLAACLSSVEPCRAAMRCLEHRPYPPGH